MLVAVLGTLVLSLPPVQTSLARYATEKLNNEFGTNIQIERASISLLTLNVTLKDIYVEDYKKDTLAYLQKLSTSVLSLRNMANGKLEFGDIDVDGLVFNLKTYKGENDTNLDVFVDKLDDGKPRAPGTPPFFMSSSAIEISNGHFRLMDENLEKQETLNFNDLQVKAQDFQILGPDVSMDILGLSLMGKRGLRLENLATQFKYTKEQMLFDNLSIKTPKSKIDGKLQFNYDRKDFQHFTDSVRLQANFVESEISLDEINVFYDEFGSDKTATFSGAVGGTLNDLSVKELFLFSDNTVLRGDFNLRNIFNAQAPFVVEGDIENLTSSYYQLRGLLPDILGKNIPSSFQRLGQFTIRGGTEVTDSSLGVKVNLNTAIGSSYADLQMTNINNIDNAAYIGFISLIDFNLGKFIENEDFGTTSLDLNVEGKGFVADYLNTEAIGQVYSIEFNNYNYQNIKVSGILKEQLFDGSLSIDDANVKLDFKGLADFGEERNDFNFIASVDYADFKTLNFIKDSVSVFKGDVNMDIAGNNVDDIVGDINFTNTRYQNHNDTYFFDDFSVSSTFESDSTRTIQFISPDIITGYMKGNFKVRELGKLMQNSIGSIYTNYRPFEISSGQILNFNFKIYNKIVDVFFPEVKFGPDTYIRGNIEADEGDFKLTFKSPEIEAFKNKFDNIELKIDNKNPLFNTFVSVENMNTVYYDVSDFSLINTTLKDTLFFRTEFKGGSQFDDSYNLNFYHTFNENNKSVVGIKRSEVNFKENTWVLNRANDSKNKVIVTNTLDSISIEEIVMDNNKSEQIRLRGQLADSTYKDLQLQFKLVSLDKIAPLIDSLKLKGAVDGYLNVLQKENIYLPSSNLNVTDLSVNDIRLGDLEIGIFGNNDLTEFGVSTWLNDNGREKFSINGKIFNTGKMPVLDLLANFNGFDLSPFNPLGQDVISNIRGRLNGNVRISDEADNPKINGLLNLEEGGLGIPYLNVDYDFAGISQIRFEDHTFNFDNIQLRDIHSLTRATLDGGITHDYFRDWTLDLDLNTNNQRFLVLNTDFDEEALYYGTGYVNGKGKIFGTTDALNITMDAATAKGTSLKIPLSDLTSVGDYSFINFIEKKAGGSFEEQRVLDDYQGLELAFDLAVTPDAEVEIVVDRNTGSSLKGTGEGILLIDINTNGKFNMYGEFIAVTGEYNFKYGGIIDKRFKVRPGGRIIWDGDPLAASLDIEAVYGLNANPGPLLDGSGFASNIPTEVVVRLDGELERPSIDFNIEFPGTNSVRRSELQYALQDPTVEERNAFFLLAQGTFVNDQDPGSGLSQQAVTGNLIQTASGLVNSLLAGNNDKLNFGLSYEQGLLDRTLDQSTEDRIGVTVSTQISDRILVNGRVGVPVGGVGETVVAGDVEVQVLLNEQGTLSAKIFNRENQIQQFLAERQGYTQGLGLSYQVDFNSFKDLLHKVFKKKEEEKPEEESILPDNVMGRDSLIKFYPKTTSPRRK